MPTPFSAMHPPRRERAAALGAHWEPQRNAGAAHWFAADVYPSRQLSLLGLHSFECFVTNQEDAASASISAAVDSLRELGPTPSSARRCGRQPHISSGVETRRRRHGGGGGLFTPSGSSQSTSSQWHTNVMASISNLDEDRSRLSVGPTRALELAERHREHGARIAATSTLGARTVIDGSSRGWTRIDEAIRTRATRGSRQSGGTGVRARRDGCVSRGGRLRACADTSTRPSPSATSAASTSGPTS